MSVPKRKACLAMLYSFSVGMVGAALRLGMFQHFDGQKIIDELKPVIVKAVDDNLERTVDEMWQFAPQIDLMQISHEKMSSKMFIT
jgi:urease accessory protein